MANLKGYEEAVGALLKQENTAAIVLSGALKKMSRGIILLR